MRIEVDRNNTIFQSIKLLGDNSKKSYVILGSTSHNFEILYVNRKFCKNTGFESEELIHHPYHTLFTFENNRNLQKFEETIHTGILTKVDILLNNKNRMPYLVDVTSIPFKDIETNRILTLLIFDEFSEQHLKQTLHYIEELIYTAIENESLLFKKLQIICDGLDEAFHCRTLSTIFIREQDKIQMVMSKKFGLIDTYWLERKKEFNYYNDLIEQSTIQINELSDLSVTLDIHEPIIKEKKFTMFCKVPIINHKDERIGIVIIFFHDINIENDYQEFLHKINNLISLAFIYNQKLKKISYLAYNDVSTGTPNRLGFTEKLMELEKRQIYGYIQIIEPSEFSEIVELYGRDAGDELLKQLCRKLLMMRNREEDFIGRFSSSKIIIFSHRLIGEKAINFQRILEILVETPFTVQSNHVYITLKSGIAPFNEKISYKDAIRFAENSFSEAKKHAGNVAVLYQKDMDEMLEEELLISSHLTEAVKDKEIEVYLQPKVCLKSRKIRSIEALARWNSPILGFISPQAFMPVAEKTGLIRNIDLQVIEQVLQWINHRKVNGKPLVPIAVNISPEHFYHPKFIAQLMELVKTYNAEPSNIIIEITENMSLVDLTRAKQIMNELKHRGFRTSVDDFGMGYSSLNYLQELPFSELKIDRNFTIKLKEPGTYAIVKAIIDIARALNIETVAEGVETEEQAAVLEELGCSIGQGYLYSKPISMEEFDEKYELLSE